MEHRAGFEPAPSGLKGQHPGPLDERCRNLPTYRTSPKARAGGGSLGNVAHSTGFEPAISRSTGGRLGPLGYECMWRSQPDLNRASAG